MLVMMAGPMLYSQGPGFSGYTASWLEVTKGQGDDRGEGIVVDEWGNVYVGGIYETELHFPSANQVPPLLGVALRDAWVGRLDSSGQWEWGVRFAGGGDNGVYDVAYDLRGYVYAAGFFSQSVNIGGKVLASHGGRDGFLVKLEADNGSVVWVRQLSCRSDVWVRGVAVEPDGDVYVVGDYMGDTLSWDNSTKYVASDSGARAGFVARVDSSGSLHWLNGYGGDTLSAAYFRSVAVDAGGMVYAGGDFSGSVDFDASTGSGDTLWVLADDDDPFLLQLDEEGTLIWLTHFRGIHGSDRGFSVSVDEVRRRVYLAGEYLSDTLWWGVYDLNSSGAASYRPLLYRLSHPAVKEAFVLGVDTAGGEPFWHYQMGDKGSDGHTGATGVAVDRDGDVYVTGWFDGEIYFDIWGTNPSLQPGYVGDRSLVGNSVFVWKWDWDLPNADSGVVWYEVSEGYDASGLDIAVDGCKHVYVTGEYKNDMGMIGGQVGALTSTPDDDVFVYKMDQYDCPDCILAAACHEYASPLGNNTIWTQSGFYVDVANKSMLTCNDTLFISLTIYPSPPVSLGASWGPVVCAGYPYLVQPSPPGGQLTVPYPGVMVGYDPSLTPPGYYVQFDPVPGPVVISYSYTDDYGCTTVVSDTVQVDTSAGCNPHPLIRPNGDEETPVFRYGPTVVRDGLNVYWGGTEALMMSVYDISGRLRRHIRINPGAQRIMLDELPAGAYYMRSYNRDFSDVIRFVKVH